MITSVHNPRIKELRKLSQRKERQTAGQLLLEGVRLISDAWQSGQRPLLTLYEPSLIEANPGAAALLNTLATAQSEMLACTRAVFASLTDTVHPQGIAALFPVPEVPLAPMRTLTLILDGIRDPGNAGTLLRSAEAAGAELAVFGPGSVDPFNEKVLRAAMGAHFRLPIRACSTWAQVLPLLQDGVACYVADAAGEHAYDQVDWRIPSILVVGAESTGASAETRAMGVAITIPMAGKTESLNAGVAGSIILFEAARQRRNPR